MQRIWTDAQVHAKNIKSYFMFFFSLCQLCIEKVERFIVSLSLSLNLQLLLCLKKTKETTMWQEFFWTNHVIGYPHCISESPNTFCPFLRSWNQFIKQTAAFNKGIKSFLMPILLHTVWYRLIWNQRQHDTSMRYN